MTNQKTAVDLTSVDTVPRHKVGEETTTGGATYIYLEAADACVATRMVRCMYDGKASKAAFTTSNLGAEPLNVAIALQDVASGSFAWFAIGPFLTSAGITVYALASCAASSKLYTTTTTGGVDDTATTLVEGLALSAGPGGSAGAAACVATKRLTVNS